MSLAAIRLMVLRKVVSLEGLIRESLVEVRASWVLWALGAKGLAKRGWEGAQQDLFRMLVMGRRGQQEQLGMLRMRLQGQPEMLLTERQGQ